VDKQLFYVIESIVRLSLTVVVVEVVVTFRSRLTSLTEEKTFEKEASEEEDAGVELLTGYQKDMMEQFFLRGKANPDVGFFLSFCHSPHYSFAHEICTRGFLLSITDWL